MQMLLQVGRPFSTTAGCGTRCRRASRLMSSGLARGHVVLEPDLVGGVDVAGKAQRSLLAVGRAADRYDRDEVGCPEESEF